MCPKINYCQIKYSNKSNNQQACDVFEKILIKLSKFKFWRFPVDNQL